MYIRPPLLLISVQYFNSLPYSSFKCRPFYPIIKQNMAHSSLIFKYPKHYATTQQNNTLSPILQLKIRRFRILSFVSLFTHFLSTVYTPPPTPLVLAAPNKTKPSTQLSPPLKLSPHDPKEKKTNHYFLSSYFLKINHSEQGHS